MTEVQITNERPTLMGWKIIFTYLTRYRRELIFLSILGLFSALANGFVPFLVGRFLDTLLTPEKTVIIFSYILPAWLATLLLWTLVQLIANSSDFINSRLSRRIGTLTQTDYLAQAASHLVTLPTAFHKEEKTGEVWDRLNRASNALSTLSETVIINLAPQILSVLIGLIIAFSINTTLAAILLVGIVVYLATLIKVVPPIAVLQKEGHKAWGDAYGMAWDSVINYQTVKQATAEAYEKDRIEKKFHGEVFSAWYKVEAIWANISAFQRFVILLTQFAIFLISVSFIQDGILTIGSLISLNGYAAMIFGPFVVLGNQWATIQNGVVSITRAEEILGIDSENKNRTEKVTSISGKVCFKNVFFNYQKDHSNILEDLNLEVSSGQVVAFVGESGVGKSTAIQLISGYYVPTQGDVLLDNYNTKTVDLNSLRGHLAVVPQEVVLFNDTIFNNIRYGSFDRSEEEVKEAARKAYADIFIEKFPEKYNQLVGERGVKLSVGEKQRVAIARAILRDPKILILDEPTSALDPQTERQITESLEKLMQGRTTFIIAHRLSTVRKADKIFVFDKGKIVEQGNHEELLAQNGLYKKLHDLHVGLH